MVDIRGEVNRPGIYKVESGAMINDVIELAGGLTIINYRDKNGKFKKIEDLLKVNGIGEALLLQIKEFITVWYSS